MRIVAGNYKGFGLYISKNKNTRPLKDLVRESVFNLMVHSKKISFQFKKSNILDLYSCTGSFGLECLSREANSVYFVEKDKNAFEVLKKNIEKLKLKNKTKIFFEDVVSFINKKKIKIKFDIIFCDPPYKSTNIENLIELIIKENLVSKNGIIILHRNKKTKDTFPRTWKLIEETTYGVSKIMFGKIYFGPDFPK